MARTRKIWMFPRNKRRLVALDISMMLRSLVVASEKGTTWGGDQSQQNKFSKMLEDQGIKGGGNQIDINNGGPRTYISQFQCIGLISKAGASDIRFTQTGEDMAYFDQPADALRWQVLKMQFPSEYSKAGMVNIDSSIKIRPAHFLIMLARDPDINGLSDADIMVPVVFGKTVSSFNDCKKKILEAREKGIESVINDVNLLATARTTGTSLSKRLKDVNDIANTFANVLIGSGLCKRIQIDEKSRIIFDVKYAPIFDEVAGIPLVNYSSANQIQDSLKIGNRRGALKDTRRIFIPNVSLELQTKKELILKDFFKIANFPISQADINNFGNQMLKNYGVEMDVILDAIKPILSNSSHYTNSNLIELSQSGNKGARDFEHAVTRVFEQDFGYEAISIGQKKRKGVGGYPDTFVIETERGKCGIIDAKAMRIYDLPHNDYAKMLTTYIPTANELYPADRELELSFVGYVSHLIGKGAKDRAQQIYDNSGIPVVLCSVYGLNSLRENSYFIQNPKNVTDLFISNPVTHIDR